MNNAPIRVLVVLAAVSLVGIFATQMFWVNRAISNEKQQFHHSVQMALGNVVESLCQIDGNNISLNNPVERVSNNYFIVRTNNKINLQSLEYLLKAEFEKRAISQDFEYGVYDCEQEKMVYGDLIQLSGVPVIDKAVELPKLADEAYYFGIYFPGRARGFFGELDFWKFTTLLTILVVIFFSYGLVVILRQKRLGAIQRDFVNNITHEFKTPLATLKVAAEVFSDPESQKPDRLVQYGKIVQAEANRLEIQVTQLLKSSLVENRSHMEMQCIDLAHVVAQAVHRFDHKVEEEQLKITFETEGRAPIQGNTELLETALFNLLDNAIKYGGGDIKVRLIGKGNSCELTIQDPGPGIPKKYRKKVFTKFFRIPSGNRHDVKGFGLGLYFVKNVLNSHGASIKILDTERSTFSMKFKKIGE